MRVARPRIEIFVVARGRLLADAVAEALDAEADLEVLGRDADLRQAAERLRKARLDIVVVDTAMVPEPSRLWIRSLAARRPDLKILSIGLDDDEAVLQCFEAGVFGHLPRGASLGRLIDVVRMVGGGTPTCSPGQIASIMTRINELAARIEPLATRSARQPGRIPLTLRERQVLEAVVRGLYNQEIAQELGLALSTVKVHVRKILKKLGAPNRRAAAQRALELDLFDPSARA